MSESHGPSSDSSAATPTTAPSTVTAVRVLPARVEDRPSLRRRRAGPGTRTPRRPEPGTATASRRTPVRASTRTWSIRPGDRAAEAPRPPRSAAGGEEARAERQRQQRRAEQPRLDQRAELDAVRRGRPLADAPTLDVVLGEVARPDALDRVLLEDVERDAVVVVAGAAEAGAQVLRRAGVGCAHLLELVPGVLHAVHRVARGGQRAGESDHHDQRHRHADHP